MNAKLEAVERGILGRCESYRNKRNQFLAEENIAFAVRSELITLDSDLAIAQAAREWLKWHNNADESNRAEHKLRAAVEKAR